MSKEVLVTRKGQTTIPAELRAKYKIKQGTRLTVVDMGTGIMFQPAVSTADLAGSGASKATPAQMKKLLDRMRDEDDE